MLQRMSLLISRLPQHSYHQSSQRNVRLLGNTYRTWNASFRCDDIKLVSFAVRAHPLGVCDVNAPRSHAGPRALIYVYLQEKNTPNKQNGAKNLCRKFVGAATAAAAAAAAAAAVHMTT